MELIEREEDLDVLMAIKTLLIKANLDSEVSEMMSSRALKAEEDIKNGRILTREEFEGELYNRLVR